MTQHPGLGPSDGEPEAEWPGSRAARLRQQAESQARREVQVAGGPSSVVYALLAIEARLEALDARIAKLGK